MAEIRYMQMDDKDFWYSLDNHLLEKEFENKVLSGKLNDAPSGRLFRADFRTLQMCQSL